MYAAHSPAAPVLPGGQTPLFVYGTLMRGQRAHRCLRGALYLGRAVLRGYALYDLHGLYPCIRRKAGGRVQGEVYAVAPAALPAIDRYEGREYARRTVTVALANGHTRACAYVYRLPPPGAPAAGSWPAYRRRGAKVQKP